MTRRYLVTGAAGFIGSHLCERLLAMGHSVLGVDRFSPYYGRHLKEANLLECGQYRRFELLEADLAQVDFDPLLADIDGVFHLAAQPGVRASWGDGFGDYVRDNVLGTQRLLDAVSTHAAAVPVVIASSSSVYGDATTFPISEDSAPQPVSPYGLTKLTVEHLARIYAQQLGLHVVCLRYFTVYGPRQRPDMAFTRFMTAAYGGETIEVLGDGNQSRDFSFVGDVVDATIRGLEGTPGRVYNIGGGQPISVNDIIAVLGELLACQLDVARQPKALGDVRRTWADTRRARRELGWSPRTDLRTGLAAQLAWIDKNQMDEPAGADTDGSRDIAIAAS
jgi:nucleoside-diphosphate-sugar epimerase